MSNVIGEYDEDGQTKVEADQCAISGQPVLGQHSILQRIKDTRYFYRYMSDYQHRLTPEKVAEIEALAGKSPEVTHGSPGVTYSLDYPTDEKE